MARLRVQEVAAQRGLNLSQLQIAVNRRLPATIEPVAIGTIRRYWYSTQNGKASGDAIKLVDINLLGTIAKVLDVPVSELLNESELGQKMAA
jgi:hypothetical protein